MERDDNYQDGGALFGLLSCVAIYAVVAGLWFVGAVLLPALGVR